jgi:hypothetical protein
MEKLFFSLSSTQKCYRHTHGHVTSCEEHPYSVTDIRQTDPLSFFNILS